MTFVLGLVLIGLLAAAIAVVPFWRRDRRFAATGGGLFVLGMAAGIYLLIGRPDLALEPPQAAGQSQPAELNELVERLADRLERSPDDPEGWTMLGRTYVMMGRYREAASAFNEAQARTPGEDVELLASFAEARVLADPRAMEGEAAALFERVLTLDPENPRGLWYGGLAAQARGEDAVALERFRKLLEKDLPAEFRGVVESSMSSIDPAAVEALLSVRVDVSPQLAGELPPNGVLFVSIREISGNTGSGPPLAARRLAFFDFPQTVPVTRNDLLRGGELPEGPFIVTARVSADGDAAPGAGDIEGTVRWDPQAGETVDIRLDRKRGE